MKIGKHNLRYLLDTENKETEMKYLDFFLPRFFNENKIETDSDIVATCIPDKHEIGLRPLGENNLFWAYDNYNNPWKTKYGATIISTKIGRTNYTLYDMKTGIFSSH